MNFGLACALDDRIGLCFTDGSVRYFFRSTLAKAGGYFSARFGNFGQGLAYTDEHNQLVYAMEKDGALFAKYIEPFILAKIPGELPPFSENPQLWRLLRKESTFYGLEDLSEILSITHSCPYSRFDDQGILYWLGTDKGKQLEYQNPQSTGAIAVHVGKVGDLSSIERAATKGFGENSLLPYAYTQESRQALVQYRPRIIGFEDEFDEIDLSAKQTCYSLWCKQSLCEIPTIVDLKSVKVRLAAYSLRQDRCGMTDWNFEGSEDGEEWVVLHKARNDRHVGKMDETLKQVLYSELQPLHDGEGETEVEISQDFAERELRHTWQINPQSRTFFRFFRIIGSGSDYERHADASNCLHGVGLELYGDVHEE